MFAVIKTGGKQYRVAADDRLTIEKAEGNVGDIIQFGEVLMVGVGADATIGAPFVEGALVTAEVVEHGRARKVIAFKKRRRQNSKRTRGHRQHQTVVRISEILTDGKKPSKTAAPKKEAKTDVTAESRSDDGKSAAAKAEKPVTKAAPEKAGTAAPAAAPLFKAPKGKSDDLTAIKGIGPKAAAELNEQGLVTFAQLAKLTDKDVAGIDENMGFSTAQIEDWRDQAKELAK